MGATSVGRVVQLACAGVAAAAAVGCGASRHAGIDKIATGVTSEPVHYLPRGVQTLARGRISPARSFAIQVERYRFQRRLYSGLAARIDEHGEAGSGGGGSFNPSGGEALEWTTEQGCNTRVAWNVVYGLLRDATDRATAFSRGRRYPLSTVAIPPRFVLKGVLAYALLPAPPSRMVVNNRAGKTVLNQALGWPARCQPGESSSLMILTKKGS